MTGMVVLNQVLAVITQLNSEGCDDSTETWDHCGGLGLVSAPVTVHCPPVAAWRAEARHTPQTSGVTSVGSLDTRGLMSGVCPAPGP